MQIRILNSRSEVQNKRSLFKGCEGSIIRHREKMINFQQLSRTKLHNFAETFETCVLYAFLSETGFKCASNTVNISTYFRTVVFNNRGMGSQLLVRKCLVWNANCSTRTFGVCPIIALCVRLKSVCSEKSRWPSGKACRFARGSLRMRADRGSVLSIGIFPLIWWCWFFFFLIICLLDLAPTLYL